MSSRVGLKELSDHLGVSIGSVSNALNRPELVSDRMRERVLRAADELGFVRNGLARQLRLGVGKTIGMIVLDFTNPFFAQLASACQSAAESHGFSLVVASSDQDEDKQDEFVRLFEEQRVLGVLAIPVGEPTEAMAAVSSRGTSMVLFEDATGSEGAFSSVAMDGHLAGQLAVRHLAERGRRRIAFVGGPIGQVRDRWNGARQEALELGVSLELLETGTQGIQEGRAVGEALARRQEPSRPDAVFAANDSLALGVLQAFVMHPELSVPDDLAIVGVDDIEWAQSAIVPLTTIRQPVEEIAAAAVQLLIANGGDSEAAPRHTLLAPTLIIRGTT